MKRIFKLFSKVGFRFGNDKVAGGRSSSTAIPAIFLLFCFWGLLNGASAQETAPYLTSATFYVSVDDWADVWLNGIPIIDSQPYTPVSAGFKTIVCLPEHICYFKRENILAIENTDAYRNPPPRDNHVGIAYILRLSFSNSTELTLSSNDPSDHKSFYIQDRMMGEPIGWHQMTFNDESWAPAQNTGTMIPGAAALTDPQTHLETQFLSAFGITSKAQIPGERHLYRRKFFLSISPNPICTSLGQKKTEEPLKKVVSALPTLTPTPTSSIFPTQTPIPKSIIVGTATASPTPLVPQQPTKIPASRRQKIKPAAPPSLAFGPRSTVEPIEEKDPIMPVRVVPPTPTPAALFTPEAAPGGGQTVVFGKPPANIYISFADGPGVYRLEVFDASSVHLRNLFERHIVAQKDAWVEWDGKDDQGRDAPIGRYTVVYSKDAKELNKITVLREAAP